VSEEAGNCSDTINRNTASDNKTVTLRDTFSPNYGGRMKLAATTEPVNIQGNSTVNT